PKLSHDMVAMFFEDLVSAEQRQELDTHKVVKVEHSFEGQRFAGELKIDEGRYRLSLARVRVAAGAGGPPRPAASEARVVPDLPPPRTHAAPTRPPAPAPAVIEDVPEDMSETIDEDAQRVAEALRALLQR